MSAKRYGYLDVLRIFCAVMVVVAHIPINAVTLSKEGLSQLSIDITSIIHQEISVVVPVFLMITGTIFFNSSKEYTFKDIWKYVRRFVICLLTFGVAFSFVEQVFAKEPISVLMLWNALKAVISGNLWDHMWYVYMIIGIYLVLPIIKPFFAKASNKTVIYCLILLFVFNALFPQIEKITGINIGFNLPISGMYLFYIIAGGLLFRLGSEKLKKWAYISIFTSLLCIVGIAYTVFSEKPVIILGFQSAIMAVFAVSFFIIVQYFGRNINSGAKMTEISNLTWGVYIIHPVFIHIVTRGLKINPLQYYPYITLPLMMIFCTLLSFITIYLLRKIKFVRQYIF